MEPLAKFRSPNQDPSEIRVFVANLVVAAQDLHFLRNALDDFSKWATG